MKITHYMAAMRLEDGGVVRAVLDLCGAMARRGHDVSLLTFDATDVPRSWLDGDAGVPRVETLDRLAGRLPRLGPGAARRARRRLGQSSVAHLHVPWDPVCLQLGRAARRVDVPYVVGIHGMLDDWSMGQKGPKKRLFLTMGGRSFLERAAAVHCTAEAERQQSAKWYPRGHPVVVPLIFDLDPYRELPGPQLAREKFAGEWPTNGDASVLFLSRLHPKKRLELLIESARLLRDRGVGFKLMIAGTGEPSYVEELRRLADRHGVAARVAFLGFVSGREKVSLYEASDVFVLPTSQENWGYVLLESLACATPVITTRGVDIWSELQESGGAVIVEGSAAAVADAIGEVLGDEPRRESMRQRGRAWVLDNLDVDEVARRYEQLYQDVVN